MNEPELFNLSLGLLFTVALAVSGQDTAGGQKKGSDPQAFIKSLAGKWEGTCRTWFRPGELADESQVNGEFKLLLEGNFLRHTYKGTIQGKPRSGEETIVFNKGKQKFQTTWIDNFHMNYGILYSEGNAADKGFVVSGTYDVGPGDPPWGWKTVYELTDKNNLIITAYNVTPDGQEAKAVETGYIRQGE